MGAGGPEMAPRCVFAPSASEGRARKRGAGPFRVRFKATKQLFCGFKTDPKWPCAAFSRPPLACPFWSHRTRLQNGGRTPQSSQCEVRRLGAPYSDPEKGDRYTDSSLYGALAKRGTTVQIMRICHLHHYNAWKNLKDGIIWKIPFI